MNLYCPTIVARAWKRVGLQQISLVAGLGLAVGGAFALSQPARSENLPNQGQDASVHDWQDPLPRALPEHVIYLVDSKERGESVQQEEYRTLLEIALTTRYELYQRSFTILNSSEPEEAKLIDLAFAAGSHEMPVNALIVDLRGR